MPDPAIRLLLADVDGTLVTSEKALTAATVDAVHALYDAGIQVAVTSGRPPRGMAMLVEPLALTTPIAAFNGGLFVTPDMAVQEERVLAEDAVEPAMALMADHGLDVWLYRGAEWLVTNPDAPHVAREAFTVQFEPTVVADLHASRDRVAKLVGVSDDHAAVAKAASAAHRQLGHQVTAAASQPYYLDITHPDANKGAVVLHLSRVLGIPTHQIATIGDMPNDVAMFQRSGLSIAMGNASRDVQVRAHRVTASNDDEGFARAIREHVLPPQ